MTLANYLETPQAREDVRELLASDKPQLPVLSMEDLCWVLDEVGAWRRVLIWDDAQNKELTANYRPDGDRFVVTDLGEGVRALRLKGCALLDIKPKVDEVLMQMYRAGLLHPNYGPAALIQGEIGTIGNVTAADLPDALCRVMLASLKVSEVQP